MPYLVKIPIRGFADIGDVIEDHALPPYEVRNLLAASAIEHVGDEAPKPAPAPNSAGSIGHVTGIKTGIFGPTDW